MQQDEEAESEFAEGGLDCGEIAGQQLDPENGSTGAAGYSQEVADWAIENGLDAIVKTVVVGTGQLPLPSANLLFAEVARIERGGDTPAAVFTSLAEQLMREKLEQEQQQEAESEL